MSVILTKLLICKAGKFLDHREVGRKCDRCCLEEDSPPFFEGKLRKVADRNMTITDKQLYSTTNSYRLKIKCRAYNNKL